MKIVGKINVSNNRVSCDLDIDFSLYYRSLIYKSFPNLKGGLCLPKFGPHITVANSNFHVVDNEAALQFNNQLVNIYYDPTEIYLGGLTKGWVGFYVKAHSVRLSEIQKIVVKEFLTSEQGFHITICSTKFIHAKR